MEFGACVFICVFYTAYRVVLNIIGKLISLCSGLRALLPLSSNLFDVIWQVGPLVTVQETDYKAAQSLVSLIL